MMNVISNFRALMERKFCPTPTAQPSCVKQAKGTAITFTHSQVPLRKSDQLLRERKVVRFSKRSEL